MVGLNGELVEVEADLAPRQQPTFLIVGLPDAAIQEAKERIRFAIENSGFNFPRYKVTVNLAPADLKKEGAVYDLAMAVSILCTTKQLSGKFDDSIFLGELALDGKTRSTTGILPATIFAKENNYKNIFVPTQNAAEAALISGINVYPVFCLAELYGHLSGFKLIAPIDRTQAVIRNPKEPALFATDMSDICGQEQAKRALEIAAAGSHNVLLVGPPGSGKTLLAKTFPTVLPALSEPEIIEVTKIYSIAGLLPKDNPVILNRPFRSPHHTGSGVALVGGGKIPKPGEISLAHRGVLFLDEFPEFPRAVIENLRQPLEDGTISISRAQGTLTFPARFTLIASQNPCPCGYSTDPDKSCLCTPIQIIKYQKKISGPIIDRFDLHVSVPRLNYEKLQPNQTPETSTVIRNRVEAAIRKQNDRFANSKSQYNSEMNPAEIKKFCELDNSSTEILKNAISQLFMSARSVHRVLKVARTIADLAGESTIKLEHLAEALQYRPKQN
ncbi:MAG: Mg chelatase, subunit ChlI [Parcubacteria group bacterium GW2011_GWC2_39_14]|nr:MAG: Mg chelatase, subunit ChlI [Parcubacteria group bacterium GW2011_GWC2_39_14]KKR53229.1 MAG: Mg chelatase, subunit ChlI [Parcubacteria group bacterium GW2011_GWA2_40_23]